LPFEAVAVMVRSSPRLQPIDVFEPKTVTSSRRIRPIHRPLLLISLVSTLAGCAVGPDYRPPEQASLGVPDAWRGGDGSAVDPAELGQWWTRFEDPLLTGLVDRAAAGNLDVAVAVARLRQARESLVQSRADRLPSLSASSSARRNYDVRGGGRTIVDDQGNVISNTGGGTTTTYSLGGDASWTVDLFGGLSRSVEAARASRDSVALNLADVRTAIAAEVVRNYIDARTTQARLEIARGTLETQDENLQIADWRAQAGLVSSLDVEQARAQRAQTAASIPTLETTYAAAANRLAVLTGQAPGAVDAELVASAPIPTGPDSIATGIPADTLRQRPDVRAAERTLASATAQIGVAKAQLFPALRIGGSIGSSALSLGELGDIITANLFSSLSQTIFDGGRLRSQLRSARAEADAAFSTYKQTVLLGLEEVENALVSLNAAQRRGQELAIAFDASNNAAILARSQYRAGLTDFQTLLESERSLLTARDSLATARADRATAIVQLYLALGGGWQPDAPLPTGEPE